MKMTPNKIVGEIAAADLKHSAVFLRACGMRKAV